MKACLFLLAALGIAATGRAQQAASVSAPFSAANTRNFKQTMGFGQAEVTTVSGEKSLVYVFLSPLGFGDAVPVFYREEDIDKLGAQPLFVSVDNVQLIRVVATGQYLEHMVVNGKRRHQLAVRVVEGPVELFSYTQVQQATGASAGFQPLPTVSAKRQWYVRRQGALVEVQRGGFTKQMKAYFYDDPVVVEALADKKLGYDDLSTLVRIYNQHQPPSNGASK